MTALSKFLMLLALFLLASHANAFTNLSLVAGNQVWFNHFIQLQQLMSYPTNEPSRKPIHKPIKWMDLDAELLNNLLSQKTWVAYSEPKQDAELPSKNTDSTSTQTCRLCHNKKSELESLAEQPIAATNSSQKYVASRPWLALSNSKLASGSWPIGKFCLASSSWPVCKFHHASGSWPISKYTLVSDSWLACSKTIKLVSRPWLALSKYHQLVSSSWPALSKLFQFEQDVQCLPSGRKWAIRSLWKTNLGSGKIYCI